MILTKEQGEVLFEISKPVIKWLNDNCHPHCQIIITPSSVELVEGVIYRPTDEFIKD